MFLSHRLYNVGHLVPHGDVELPLQKAEQEQNFNSVRRLLILLFTILYYTLFLIVNMSRLKAKLIQYIMHVALTT